MHKVIGKISDIIHKRPVLVLMITWALLQIILLLIFGIVTTGEATQYSNEAQNFLQQGHFSEPKYIFYSVYIFLHIIFLKFGFETVGLYLMQLFTNLLAMYLFYKTAYRLTKKKNAAFLSALLLLVCYSWQYWVVYLYTESFFCSLIIIFAGLLFGTEKRNNLQYSAVVFIFILILFARPTGIFIIPVLCIMLVWWLISKRKTTQAIAVLLAMTFAFTGILNYAMKAGSSYDFITPLLEKNVLCYLSEQPPVSAIKVEGASNSLLSIWNYIEQNPGTFIKLSALKFLSFWGMTRPYYSTFHNVWLMCFFYPLYIFAFIGISALWKTQPAFVCFATGMILIFTLSVMVTCDDWNNRFNLPIIPFVILFAGIGLHKTLTTRLRVK